MDEIVINTQLKKIAPNLHLGIIKATVEITKHDNGLWLEIDNVINKIIKNSSREELSHPVQIEALRSVYKSLGKDPSRYRSSAESLLRRILKAQGLYKINTIVDINNLISLETMHSVGSYNLDNLKNPLEFRIGKKGETYKGIGKDLIKIEDLPVFCDAEGPYGSPTSDSERAMITLDTINIMIVIISFSGNNGLIDIMQRAVDLLKLYAKATDVETLTIT